MALRTSNPGCRKQFNIRPNLLMGQRFLISRPVLERIIAAAGLKPTDTVLEIGAGRGELTRALAERAGRVIAVEKDPRLAEALERELSHRSVSDSGQRTRQVNTDDRRHLLNAPSGENVTIIRGDILKLFPEALPLPNRYRVIANIPYYLTSRLIRRLLEAERPPKDILIMVQREVAERITARPPHMNLLALSVQAYGKPEILFPIPAQAFRPPPSVDSAFIRIGNIRKDFFREQGLDERKFFAILRAAFQGKRKTLENSLARNANLSKSKVADALGKLNLSGKRPEALGLEDWVKLARAFQNEMD